MSDETSTVLNVLFVGGVDTDVRRVVRQLRRGGFVPRWEVVDSEGALQKALQRGSVDIVLGAGNGGALDPGRALALTKEFAPEVPFVVVAETLPEEQCVDLVRSGAANWVTFPNLGRLGPVVARERQRSRDRDVRPVDPPSHRVLAAQEAERRRIAAALHDDFGQILIALRLILQAAEGAVGAGGLSEAIQLVDQAIQRTRDLSVELWPAVLDQLGLPAALGWLADRHCRTSDLRIDVSVEPIGRLPFAVEVAGFRVAQEALVNVARHADAHSVEVTLSVSTDAIQMAIRDDGKGFDLDRAWRQAADGASLGLVAMRERARLAGGWLEVESTPGRGTLVRLGLPAGRAE